MNLSVVQDDELHPKLNMDLNLKPNLELNLQLNIVLNMKKVSSVHINQY